MALPADYQKIIDDLVREALPTNTGAEVSQSSPPATEPSALSSDVTPMGTPRAPFDPTIFIAYLDVKPSSRDGGIGCIALWDSQTEKPYLYGANDLETAINHLEGADVIVSFNGKVFDVPLMTRYAKRAIMLKEHIDLWEEMRKSLMIVGKDFAGYDLTIVSAELFPGKRTWTKSDAVACVAEGRWMELATMGIADVTLIRDLCTFIRKNGYLLDLNGEEVSIPLPRWFVLRGEG